MFEPGSDPQGVRNGEYSTEYFVTSDLSLPEDMPEEQRTNVLRLRAARAAQRPAAATAHPAPRLDEQGYSMPFSPSGAHHGGMLAPSPTLPHQGHSVVNSEYYLTSTLPPPADMPEQKKQEILRRRAELAAQGTAGANKSLSELSHEHRTVDNPTYAGIPDNPTDLAAANRQTLQPHPSTLRTIVRPAASDITPTPSMTQRFIANLYMRLIQWGEMLAAAGGSIILIGFIIFLAEEFGLLYPEEDTLGLNIDPFTFVALSILVSKGRLLNHLPFLFTAPYETISGLLRLSTNDPTQDYCDPAAPSGMLVPYSNRFKVTGNGNSNVYFFRADPFGTGCYVSIPNGIISNEQLSARFPGLQFAASNELALNRAAIAVWIGGALAFTVWFANPDNVEAHDALVTAVIVLIKLVLRGAAALPLSFLQGGVNIVLLPTPQKRDAFNSRWNNGIDRIALWLSDQLGMNTIVHTLQAQGAAGLPKSIIAGRGKIGFSPQSVSYTDLTLPTSDLV